MPYITTGVLVLAFGLIVSLFIKPYPKLDAPANLEVKQVEDTLVLSWNKNDKASNGYIIYYSLYIESVNEEDQPEVFMIEVPQQDGEKIKIEIKELDLSKPYAFAIACNGVNGSYNGSDYTEIIFDSNK